MNKAQEFMSLVEDMSLTDLGDGKLLKSWDSWQDACKAKGAEQLYTYKNRKATTAKDLYGVVYYNDKSGKKCFGVFDRSKSQGIVLNTPDDYMDLAMFYGEG